MKYAFALVTSFCITLFCNAQINKTTEKVVWKSFTDTASSFNLQYPSNWYLKLTNEKAVFVLKAPEETNEDNFLENMNLIVKYLPTASKYSSEDLSKLSLDGLKKKYPDLVVKSSNKTTWLRKDAWELQYEFSENDFAVNIIQKVLYYQDWFYVCTYTAQANKKDIYVDKANEIFGKMFLK